MTDTSPTAEWPLSLDDPTRAVHFALEPNCPYARPADCPRETEARQTIGAYLTWLSAHSAEQPPQRAPLAPQQPHSPSGDPELAATPKRAAGGRTDDLVFGRPFVLQRHHDVSEVSGTGIVADGVLFPDGQAAIHWRGRYPTTTPHPSLDWILGVHSHEGRTVILWPDGTTTTDTDLDSRTDSVVASADTVRTGQDSGVDAALREQYTAAVDRLRDNGGIYSIDDAERDQLVDAVLAVRDRRMEQLAAGRETWKAKAEEIERDRDRLASQVDQLIERLGQYADQGIANGERAGQAEAAIARVRAECDAIARDVHGKNPVALAGYREANARIRAALDHTCPDGEPCPAHDEPATGPLTRGPINWAEDVIPAEPPTTLAEAQERHRQLLHRRRASIAAVTHAWERKETAAIRDLVRLASNRT